MAETPKQLKRELGVPGAMLLGLGSMVGTGVFISLGLAAERAGGALLVAVPLAAGLATCNALSSAQLAAAHPVSGGSYEYGYRYLTPALGFAAGWMFLCAKSASAASAALTFAGYILTWLPPGGMVWRSAVAMLAVVALTALVLAGVRRSNMANVAIVGITFVALLATTAVAAVALYQLPAPERAAVFAFKGEGLADTVGLTLYATAIVFVAYTGYGRLATMGEEVRAPRRTIPRAIAATVVVALLLYLAVGFPALLAASRGADAHAPLAAAAPQLGWLIAVGAAVATLGVLLNLLLGLSRVLLAMGRRGDMPRVVAKLNAAGTTPWVAVLVVALLIGLLAAFTRVRTAWEFSAITVLVYYALANLAALRLPAADRLYPRWVSLLGLVGCLFLAFWVPVAIFAAGAGLLLLGLLWHAVARRLGSRATAA